jgi:hypothetical protein
MAVSINCLKAALDPFIPDPLNVFPIGIVDQWKNPPSLVAKASASRFNLDESEFMLFDDWWKLSRDAQDKHKNQAAEADREIEAAFVRLAAIVNDGAQYRGVRGYEHVSRVPGTGRYVIFSDHHMAFRGSRQDFFRSSGNDKLYGELLTQYADAGFTLVENGDVEELVIHEPAVPSPSTPGGVRYDWRLQQLAQVIEHHRDLYEQINQQFASQGRYVRIAGNHDQDLQEARFLEVLRGVYPDLEKVYDFLILEPTEEQDASFVIGHGHHFDRASNPKHSQEVGEVLSECLGWAYEGADRQWKWDGLDGVQRWAGGGEAFNNTLVTDDADKPVPIPIDVEAALLTWLGSLGLISPFAALGGVPGIVAILMAELSKESVWEDLFNGNIAWEYFESEDAAEAVFNEVLCGERWFKMRHLDEVLINERLEELFRTRVPYLILGHSHEARQRAWDPARSEPAEHYLNSGAAGRFENLIWGVEIVDGVAQVIAWHRPGGANSAAAPERRVYTPGHQTLLASDEHVALPAVVPEEEERPWLAPVLQMMMRS